MNVSPSSDPRRMPLRYILATYIETSPKVIGALIAGAVYITSPDAWPGAWAWIALGPLLVVLIGEPVWRWMSTFVAVFKTHLTVRTGVIRTREQTLAWADIGAVDDRQPWAFGRLHLHKLTFSQSGDERAKVHVWAADDEMRAYLIGHMHPTPTANPSRVHPTHEGREEENELGDAFKYRMRFQQILLASVTYGQFAVVGGGATMALAEWVETLSVGDSLVGWISSAPPVLAVGVVAITIIMGLALTTMKYANFQVRRTHDGQIVISYGLFSTHTRNVRADAIYGVVLQRNLIEDLLGRVRLSLLTVDSAAQLGSNLVLPSLSRHSVHLLLRDAFDTPPPTSVVTLDRGLRAFGSSVITLASSTLIPVLAGWAAFTVGWSPLGVLAAVAGTAVLVWHVSRVLCSQLIVDPAESRVTLLSNHVVQRQIVLAVTAVHLAGVWGAGRHPLLAYVTYYAGSPRIFVASRFALEEFDALSSSIASAVPSPRTRRRP